MSSRLVYFGNVISRADALVKGHVIAEPKWLKACKKFPPLSKPVNPELPTWEGIEQSRTHRVGNFTRLDGHRFDPKKPTQYPRDKQVTHPDQPHHIYFSKDEQRKQFYTLHPGHPVHVTYSANSESACEKWIRGGESPDSHVTLASFELERVDEDVWGEFEEIRSGCDISDIDIHNT